jgi:adenosylcobinamide-phosphate synthase
LSITLASFATVTFLVLIVEGIAGYPDALFRAIGHPVTWIGALIARMDRALNRESDPFARRRACGVVAVLVLLTVVLGVAVPVQILLWTWWGIPLLILLMASLPAQRSLHDHVSAVADELEKGLEDGRRAVSMIVGRNTSVLDEAGVARAAIESLAENFSDGVTAPVFWMAVAGLPGAATYKAINTADSMIGHRTPRHEAFGWAAARLDDLVNLPAARLTALWIVLAALVTPGASAGVAIRAVRRDARHHRSPNAGWPEAAMAGALGLKLNGPRVYGSALVDDVYMGDGRREAGIADIRRAIALYRRALAVEAGLILMTAMLPSVF